MRFPMQLALIAWRGITDRLAQTGITHSVHPELPADCHVYIDIPRRVDGETDAIVTYFSSLAEKVAASGIRRFLCTGDYPVTVTPLAGGDVTRFSVSGCWPLSAAVATTPASTVAYQ